MSSNDKEDQDAARRNEINMFSQMALGGGGGGGGGGGDFNNDMDDDGSGHDTSAAFSGGSMILPSKNDRKKKDRQSPPLPEYQTLEAEYDSFKSAHKDLKMSQDISATAAAPPSQETGGGQKSLQEMFSAAANMEMDSGTFAMTSSTSTSKKENSTGQSNNLDAALAAFAFNDDDDDDSDGMVTKKKSNKTASNKPVQRTEKFTKRMTEEYPMYTEEVLLPRPLFFGPILPPRVINEARQILTSAFADHGHTDLDVDDFFNNNPQKLGTIDNNEGKTTTTTTKINSPKLSLLPLEVRNVVGALRTYGFGISAFPIEDEKSQANDDAFWTGSSYVSTFQPVFGDAARASRLKNKGESNNTSDNDEVVPSSSDVHPTTNTSTTQEPETRTVKTVSKKYKRPGGVAGFNDGISTADTTTATAASTATDVTEDPNSKNNDAGNDSNAQLSEQALFSMWARGENSNNNDDNDSNSIGNNSNNSGGSFGKQSSEISDLSVSTTRSKITGSVAASAPSGTDASENVTKSKGFPRPMSDQDLFSQWARGESSPTSSTNNLNSNGTFMAEANNSFTTPDTDGAKKAPPAFGSNFDPGGTFQKVPLDYGATFQRIPDKTDTDASGGDDSDDDSIVGSELKKKVGVNEHLDAALASLVDDGPLSLEQGEGEDPQGLIPSTRVTSGGRPLSNLELTSGSSPLYGVDDPSLPVESDLGIHETKDDQQRTVEQNKSQDIIEKFVSPNIFGPVACPNPAMGPDDNHSWNSRAAPSQRYSMGAGGGLAITSGAGQDRVGVLPVPSDFSPSPRPPAIPRKHARNTPRHTKSGSSAIKASSAASTSSTPTLRKSKNSFNYSQVKRGGRYSSRSRYGWWSLPDESEPGGKGEMMRRYSSSAASESSVASPIVAGAGSSQEANSMQLPPLYHSSYALHVDTQLEPSPEMLKEENLPLSSLHSATSMAQALPFLSDRPPSHRFLQIDTQAGNSCLS